jgi:HAD superfamily hydrolase (TIGR01549 family)
MIAICFDVGGTLVQRSQGLAQRLLQANPLDRREAIKGALERYFLCGGLPAADAIRKFEEETGIACDTLVVQNSGAPDCALFPDVLPTLSALASYKLATISNSIAWDACDLQSLGLGAFLQVQIESYNVGFAKPHAGIFRAAERALDARGSELLMVGDSWENDFLGARRAGWHAIFLDRGSSRSHHPGADNSAIISTLLDLPRVLERWQS